MNNIESVIEFFRTQPIVTLFLVLGLGQLVGRFRVAGITLGAVGGTLLISLVLGRYGFQITAAAQSVGFALFMFGLGHQAGPQFIEVLKTQGLRYLALSIVVAGIGYFITLFAGRLLDLPTGGAAGLFAGALTATPALAAAQEAVRSGIAAIPEGLTREEVIDNIGTSYAITYLVGTLGMIAAVRVLPRVLGIDLAQEAQKMDLASKRDDPIQLQARAYRVASPEFCAAPLSELAIKYWDGLAVVRLRRDGQWIDVQRSDRLQPGDEIYVYGDASFFLRGAEGVGPEIPVISEAEFSASSTRVVIARREAIGRRLEELELARKHGLVVIEVRRNGLVLPLTRELTLVRGDVLSIVGPRAGIDGLTELLGPAEVNAVETDMSTFTFGIALGAAIGLLTIDIAGAPIGLGVSGGLLLVGIATGWWNSTRPTVGQFPEPARWVLMEFGLLIFICGVGLSAGDEIVETFQRAGPALLLASLAVIAVPLVGGYILGRVVFRLSARSTPRRAVRRIDERTRAESPDERSEEFGARARVHRHVCIRNCVPDAVGKPHDDDGMSERARID